jgi:hypothetical protein
MSSITGHLPVVPSRAGRSGRVTGRNEVFAVPGFDHHTRNGLALEALARGLDTAVTMTVGVENTAARGVAEDYGEHCHLTPRCLHFAMIARESAEPPHRAVAPEDRPGEAVVGEVAVAMFDGIQHSGFSVWVVLAVTGCFSSGKLSFGES